MRTVAQEIASQIALKLFLRSRGKGRYGCDSGERGVHAIQHILFYRFLLVTRHSLHGEGF